MRTFRFDSFQDMRIVHCPICNKKVLNDNITDFYNGIKGCRHLLHVQTTGTFDNVLYSKSKRGYINGTDMKHINSDHSRIIHRYVEYDDSTYFIFKK